MPTESQNTKNIIIDACSLINLVNGSILPILLNLPHHFYCVGDIVIKETKDIHHLIKPFISSGQIHYIDSSTISAITYLTLLGKYNLGNGETECIAYATSNNFSICTDDKKARSTIIALFGKNRLTGTPALMLEAVRFGLISSMDADIAYAEMLAAGAFLPEMRF